MRCRRVNLLATLGVLTTLFFALAAPHLWYFAFRPEWTSVPIPGVGPSTPLGAISRRTRPFIDLYAVSPAAYRGALAQSSPPLPPTTVRTAADPASFARVDTALCGFPFRAMASEAWIPVVGPVQYRWNIHLRQTDSGPILLPLRPLVLGFLADTVVFAAAWALVLAVPVYRPGWWREGRRLRRGRCPVCDYDLAWNFHTGCPECGWRRAPADGGVAP